MSDRLREAIEMVERDVDAVSARLTADGITPASYTDTVLAAARRFLALTETGQEYRDIDYCVEHFESAWSPDECWKQVYGEDDHYVPWDSPCRIVRVQLIPADYLTEEET